jgi:hypothetical protein
MHVPLAIWVVVFATTTSITPVIVVALWFGARGSGRPIGRVLAAVAAFLLGWGGLAVALAASGVLRFAPDRFASLIVPLMFAVFVVGGSLAVRQARALDRLLALPRVQAGLTLLQLGRALGVVFLFLWAQHKLPALFAFPAGCGDLLVALTAPLGAYAAWHARRRGVIAWNVLGLLDYVGAVGIGIGASPTALRIFYTHPSTRLFGALPMSLFPTYLVACTAIIHISLLRHVLARGDQTPGIEEAPTRVAHGTA